MKRLPDSTPVLIGVGQYAERPDEEHYCGASPMDLAGEALKRAIADCQGNGKIAAAIDTVAAIRQFEISTPKAEAPFGKSDNPPRSIAGRVGADPQRAILEVVGGQAPQKLVGELASDIAEGRSEVAAIVGSEAISTMLALSKQGESRDWSETVGGEMEDRGYGMRGLLDKTLIAHGIATPIAAYALYENARRARLGLSLEEYRLAMGDLFAPFTRIAAANPHAAAPVVRSTQELATVTERNRIVAQPYPRTMVARDQVNQAAAIVLASVGKARALGVPEDRWVYIHGVADAKELSVLERPDMASSPASSGSVREALAIAGLGLDDMRYADLYSCFAIAVFNLLDAFGTQPDDPRGWTLTGGLPFFGGAGNNYSAHAIAEAVARTRSDPASYALVGANGGFMSKYSTGIYSRQPAAWDGEERWRKLPDTTDAVAVADSFSGTAKIETYTLMPHTRGDVACAVARAASGERCVAVAAPGDMATLGTIRDGEVFGRTIRVTTGEDGRNIFTFADD